jgi:ABC-2 type transport system permease protein
MRRFFTLLGREVALYFRSPTAYVILFFFLLLTGYTFHWSVNFLNRASSSTLVEAFFDTPFFWFAFVLPFPLITMRLFAEEYKMGTIEPLLTAPVRDVQVVMAKYVGALIFYMALWLPTLLYFLIFQVRTNMRAADATGAYFGAYGMLLLLGMFYIAIGCLASALTKNQVVAAIIAFVLISGMFFMGLAWLWVPNVSAFLRDLTYYFSPIEHMMQFSQGVIDTRPIVFYLSMTALVLFGTFQVFQYRKWKV